MIQIRNISKSYQTHSGAPVREVLKNLSLEVEKGESIAIVGPSGSGKTTLLNIVGTMDSADSGHIEFNGKSLSDLKGKKLPEFRNKHIGFVFQSHHLLPQCSLWENVLIPTLADKQLNREVRAKDLLERVGIWEQRNQKPSELSGGECQRTAFVRALINSPELILADEPTGALDQENADILADLLIELNQEEGAALIVVTHSKELAQKMDKVYHLVDGQLLLMD